MILWNIEKISEIHSTSGQFDLLIKCYLDDSEDIGHFINDKIQISNEDIKILQKFYDIVFCNQNFRSNIENLNTEIKENKYVKIIIDFINTDKKRPISLPENIKWSDYF